MTEANKILRVLPREMRLQTDRILFLTGLPKGYVTQATDVIILSECLRLGGFGLLERRFETFDRADPSAVRIVSETAAGIGLDAAGQHAWFVVPAALDLLCEAAFSDREARLTVSGAVDAVEFAIAAALGERYGLAIDVAVSGDGDASLAATLTSRSLDGLDDAFRRALAEGLLVDQAMWWRLYKLSNGALAPDTPQSRRHAGPLIVMDDGRVIGRIDSDDDTDLSFIKTASSEPSNTETAQ